MPDPWVFVRALTIGLGTLWTICGLVRVLRFVSLWKARLVPLGLSEAWLRRQVLAYTLRTTVLDPVNLGLMLFLALCWTVRLQVA